MTDFASSKAAKKLAKRWMRAQKELLEKAILTQFNLLIGLLLKHPAGDDLWRNTLQRLLK